MKNQKTMRFRIVARDFDTLSPNANIEADMHLDIDVNGNTVTVDLKTLLLEMIEKSNVLENRVAVLEDAE